MKSTQQTSIVFCHGLLGRCSCFSKLIVPLQAEGYECIAPQYGLNSTAEDVALTKATSGRSAARFILSATPMEEASSQARNRRSRCRPWLHLRACSGRGRDSQTQQSQFPRTAVFSHIDVKDGRIWLLPDGIDDFGGRFAEHEKKLVLATQVFRNPPVRGKSRRNSPGNQSPAGTSSAKKTARSSRSGARHGQAQWAQPSTSSTAAMCRCSPNRNASSM